MKTIEEQIENIILRLDSFPAEDWLTVEETVKKLTNLLTKSNEEAVKGFGKHLQKVQGDINSKDNEHTGLSRARFEVETYQQSLDGGDGE